MILALDTYYFDNQAKTVGLYFNDWGDEVAEGFKAETRINNERYVSGQFYKRELPCILSLLKQFDWGHLQTLIVDGFVYLDDHGQIGLGGYLYQILEEEIPVIGVAKTHFATIHKKEKAILRGKSKHPLFITAAGLKLSVAAQNIKKMAGNYRIPKLLKDLDRLTREGIKNQA